MQAETLEVKGIEELLKALDQAGNLNDPVYRPLHEAFQKSVKLLEEQIKQNLTDNDSVGLGDLRGSVSSEVEIGETEIVGLVGAGRGLPYAEYVENGTGPAAGHPAYSPPVSIFEPGQPLYEWVRAKGLAGTFSVKTHRQMGGKQKKIDENKKVARAIWAKIKKDGTEPHPYFFKALVQQREAIDRLFMEAVDGMLKQLKN